MAPPPSDNLQKMQTGNWYTCLTDELESLRQTARAAVLQHNTQHPDQRGNVAPLLRSLFAQCPDTAFLEAPFHCAYGFNIHLGENSYLNAGCTILDTAHVTIGARTLLGPGVHIYCADHHHDPDKRAAGLERALPVTIGDNVWIGGKAVILPGITIGDRAIVGAGSIVTKDVAAGAKVIGNPAHPV